MIRESAGPFRNSLVDTLSMSHSTRRPTGRVSFGRRHLSKEMLLPMTRRAASDISLANHLALAVCRKGQGNAHLISELNRAVYLTYYLQEAGFGNASVDLYRRAEAALDQAAGRAQCDGVWQVSAEVASMLEEILAIHDQQLTAAATRHVIEAKARFARLNRSNHRSPVSEDARPTDRHDDSGFNVSATANRLQ